MLKLKNERKRINNLLVEEKDKKNKNLIQSVLNIIDHDIKNFNSVPNYHKTEQGIENIIKGYRNKLNPLTMKKKIVIFDDDFEDEENEEAGSQALAIVEDENQINMTEDLPVYVYYTM
jgi:hypothetical protein